MLLRGCVEAAVVIVDVVVVVVVIKAIPIDENNLYTSIKQVCEEEKEEEEEEGEEDQFSRAKLRTGSGIS